MRNALLAVLTVTVLAGGIRADEGAKPAPKQGSDNPCAADAQKLCPGMHMGDGKFGPCMKANKDKLSPECREKMAARMEHKEAHVSDACKAALDKACPGMHPGDGKFGPCMKAHQGSMPDCKQEMQKFQGRQQSKRRMGRGKGGPDSGGPGASTPADGSGSGE
ncbi:MAG TPA: hypothetical protein VNI01_00130 [Elusimicrobiota bacterium]|jgi:hypothetical protein|nr:hypothetical protein [Elusimicrobiota bacterium]